MIEEYNIISIKADELKGGTTKPFVVIGESAAINKKFVAKYFNQERYGLQIPTFIEFLVCFLAEDLDISTPNCALLKIEHEIALQFNKEEMFNYSENGYLFGSELIDGAAIETRKNKALHLETYEFESIYAFDVLIRNPDRRTDKPNILEKSGIYYLIDHEQCFMIDRDFRSLISNRNLWNFISPGIKGRYLLMEKLLSLKRNRGLITFDTFIENFRRLNIASIDQKVDILRLKGINVSNWSCIKQYLVDCQQNINRFVKHLNDMIV